MSDPTSDPFDQPPSGPVYGSTDPAPVYVELTPLGAAAGGSVVLAQPQLPPRRSRGKMIGVVVGVGALLVAGTFALSQLGDEAVGGAASPEELATGLADALSNEDILGAADLLLPGERETLRQPLIDLVTELARLEVADDSLDLEHVPGIDIAVELTDVEPRPTNVDDITNVEVRGTATAVVDGDQVPIGDLLIDRVFGGERPEIDDAEDEGDFDTQFTAVERDGRWYISLFYAAAEAARGDNDIPETGIAPIGAESPEQAVADMLGYIGNLDLENLIAGLNPNEAEALQRYAPLFLDDAQQALDNSGVELTISGVEYSVTSEGDSAHVTVSNIDVTLSAHDATVSFKDGCVTVSAPDGEDMTMCTDDVVAPDQGDGEIDEMLDDLGIDLSVFEQLQADAEEAFADLEVQGIAVDKVGGEWYVSPIGTVTDTYIVVLRALDRGEIETLIDDVTTLFDTLFGAVDDIDVFGEEYEESGEYDDEGYDDDYVDGEVEYFFWFDCVNGSSSDAAECLAEAIASGKVNADEVPAAFLYPECGLFEYYNGVEIYDDSAEEYWAQVEPALDCILDAAERDGVDLSVFNNEFVAPECFQDVSPYAVEAEGYAEAWECASSN